MHSVLIISSRLRSHHLSFRNPFSAVMIDLNGFLACTLSLEEAAFLFIPFKLQLFQPIQPWFHYSLVTPKVNVILIKFVRIEVLTTLFAVAKLDAEDKNKRLWVCLYRHFYSDLMH